MAKRNSSSPPANNQKWSVDTKDFFQLRLCEIKSILTVLILAISGYEKGDGRAPDEAIFLTIQQLLSNTKELEGHSYSLDSHDGAGVDYLSIDLMWARALLEILEEIINAEGWKMCFDDEVLSNYFTAVRSRIDQANAKVEKIYQHYFQKAA